MTSISNTTNTRWLKITLFSVLIFSSLSAGIFYLVQNAGFLAGGQIALAKIIWLAYAILFWFIIPGLFILDSGISSAWRLIYKIFLFNMLGRAVIELLMMYQFKNWSPYYGIIHDLVSIFLLLSLLFIYRSRLQLDIFFSYTATLILMFMLEIYFVFYMLSHVVTKTSVVFFVPADNNHSGVLSITWAAVILLSIYFTFFTRRWLDGRFISSGN